MKQYIIRGVTDIPRACQWLSNWLVKGLQAGKPIIIKLTYESRTEAQNRKMWPMLSCFVTSKVNWPAGSGIIPPKEDWKVLFVSAYNKDTSRMVIGLAGEIVNFNTSSKGLTKPQFSELIEFIYAEGCERGVIWDDPAMKIYEEWGQQ